MTSREIVIKNLEHDNPKRPAFSHPGDRLNDFLRVGIDTPTNWEEKRWVEGKMEYYNDVWGNIWRRMVGRSRKGEIYKPVLEDWSQLDKITIPDYDNPRLYDRAREAFSKQSDKFKLGAIGGWVFDDSRYLRRLDIYLMDLIQNRDYIDKLHEIVAYVYETKIRRMAEAGADGIFIGEDWGTQTGPLIGPSMWRDIFRPIYERLIGIAHEHGLKVMMHSCGYNWLLIDDLAKAGIDCFQFDQPAIYDMPALADKLKRHKVALWSPLDIQKFLPTGDRELIRSEAKRMVDIFRGFFIIDHYGDLHGIGVEPEWDTWAYEAFVEAAYL
ncbi:MAG: hypothetical protein GX974_08805 [Clostridiales bacterium]|nr:hypothetical protein [Clostridiales bacterium]